MALQFALRQRYVYRFLQQVGIAPYRTVIKQQVRTIACWAMVNLINVLLDMRQADQAHDMRKIQLLGPTRNIVVYNDFHVDLHVTPPFSKAKKESH